MDGMDFASSRPPINQVDIIFRYLGDSSATLTPLEVAQIHGLGKAIAPTFEQGAAQAENGYNQGVADAQYAGTHANALGVPLDVWIWYAVDTGATEAMVRAYFQGIKAAGGRPAAMYGPMGTGLQLMAEGLVNGVWVANAAAWSGYKSWSDMAAAARASAAHVLQHLDHPLLGVDPLGYDFDEILKPFPAWGPNGTTNGQPQRKGQKPTMLIQFTDAPTPAEKAAVWSTDLVQRSWASSPEAVKAAQFALGAQGLATNVSQVTLADFGWIPIVGPQPV